MLRPTPSHEEQDFLLSSWSPGPVQRRLALGVVSGIFAVFVLITSGALSGIRTEPIAAFVPAYATAMFVCDSITAILLYFQFSILRSRATLIIASGYLFTALILIPWILAFPGVFAPTGLVGGPHSTAWLYAVWHGGFALFVLGYAALKDSDRNKGTWRAAPGATIAGSIAATTTLVFAAGLFFIAGEALLPAITLDATRFSPLWPYAVAVPVAVLATSALLLLWIRRRSVLDLWLMVVMSLYLIELPLSYYPEPVRFSFGWYTVRVIGFLSSSLVLIVLLYEIATVYARLLRAVLGERRERVARLMTGDAVAATIAHEVKQPLTSMITSATAGFRFLDRTTPNLDKAKQAFRQIVDDGHRAGEVVGSIRAVFRHDVRTRTALDVNELISEALALERAVLEKHRIEVHAEPNWQVPEVQGDRVQLQQVLLNLITNAVEAMAADEEPRVLRVSSGAHDSDGVVVSVADSGAGISAQDSERIFTPLFTTKSEGMGMGLSICRAIIEAHDGRLWATPNVPRGAVFQFTLRASPSP